MLQFSTSAERVADRSPSPPQTPDDGLEIGPALRRYWKVIVLCAMACIVGAVAIVMTSEASYTATARVLFDPGRPETQRQTADRDQIQYTIDSAQLETQMQLLKSEQVTRPVIDAFALDKDPEFLKTRFSPRSLIRSWLSPNQPVAPTPFSAIANEFDSRLDVRRIGQSSVLQVSFQANDGEKASRLANAVVASYIARQVAIRIEGAQRNSQFERPLQELAKDSKESKEAIKTGVIRVDSFPSADARVISAAQPPTGPSSPRSALIGAFGLTLGLGLGSLIAMIRYGSNKPVLLRQHVEGVIDVPYLGSIGPARFDEIVPGSDAQKRSMCESVMMPGVISNDDASKLRMIRTAVDVTFGHRAGHIIGISSVEAGDGKSTLAKGLALAFAATGRRTLLVDANPHNPTLTDQMNRNVSPELSTGLYQALGGSNLTTGTYVTSIPNFSIMPLGQQQIGAGHFIDRLDAPSARETARRLHELYDRIIIDLPNFSDHPEAWAMAPMLDTYLLLLRRGRTRREDAARLVSTLRSTNITVAGAVLSTS
jgi:succinoglycan biosynthesis transport protein ExoP